MSEILGYKCPNCGANIPFDAASQNLKCGHCGTEYSIETLEEYNQNILEKEDVYQWKEHKDQMETLGQVEYTCPSCGGSVISDGVTSATSCPYCGSSIIVKEQVDGSLRPDLVIPFALDKKQAITKMEEELSRKFLLPKDFKSKRYIETIQGVYLPYWLFDCNSSCSARFRATRTRTWNDGRYRYVETDYYLVYRDGTMAFEKVPVDASKKIETELLEAVEPFDYSAAVDFNAAYLSGFFADVRQEESKDCITRANERIHESMLEALTSTVFGYQSCITESSNIHFEGGDVHYALLPVYLLSKTYKDKVYTFAINGQSGKVVGEMPVDIKKAILMGVGIFLVTFIVAAVISFFLLGGRL